MSAPRTSIIHCVVDRSARFEARVQMVDGKVRAEWRPITVSDKQLKFGGFTPAGEWRAAEQEQTEIV